MPTDELVARKMELFFASSSSKRRLISRIWKETRELSIKKETF
jgi:hypothetical protein